MNEQLRLPDVDPPEQIRPDPDRADPAFWVRRVRVVRELKPGKEYEVRDLELVRGLNIIWTPSRDPSDDNALFSKSGVVGHTAGKSTLCRLIRYAIGERSFASEATRRRMRHKFPNGWLLAEVVIDGEVWVSARPLGIGAHPFCVRNGTIDDTLAHNEHADFGIFLDAMTQATVAKLSSSKFPSTDESVHWEHILPWLTRDQECRFADFIEWRHSSSEAEAPALTADERQFVVRSVLGLITDAERNEQQRNAKLVVDKRDAERRGPLLAHQASVDHRRVCDLLGIELPLPSDEMFGTQARTELEAQRAALEERFDALAASDARDTLRRSHEASIRAEANADRDVTEARSQRDVRAEALKQLVGDKSASKASLLAALPPARDYCGVPVSFARANACPLVSSAPTDLTGRRSETLAAAELAQQKGIVAAHETLFAEKMAALEIARASSREAMRAYLQAATVYDDQRGRLLEERARLTQVARLVEHAEAAWKESARQSDSVKTIADDITASYAEQQRLRREMGKAVGQFSRTFEYIVRAILGDDVEARVDTSGRSLALVVERGGERDSAAIETVKLLAFDLAALTESAQGRGAFPRFLVHDGPREADMAADIYERLFLYAQKLEECFKGEPAFQYIVTTTSSPPTALLKKPWLRAKLAGVPTEERLLGCDL